MISELPEPPQASADKNINLGRAIVAGGVYTVLSPISGAMLPTAPSLRDHTSVSSHSPETEAVTVTSGSPACKTKLLGSRPMFGGMITMTAFSSQVIPRNTTAPRGSDNLKQRYPSFCLITSLSLPHTSRLTMTEATCLVCAS